MATDKRGRKLPRGIRQTQRGFEGRFMHQGINYTVYGKTVTEAVQKLSEARLKAQTGSVIPKDRITVDQWFAEWIETYKRPVLKPTTTRSYISTWTNRVSPIIGHMPLREVRVEHIQRVYTSLEGFAPGTKHYTAATMHGVFQQAVKNQLIAVNPVALAEPPKSPPRAERTALTQSQQELFLEYARPHWLYRLFYFTLRTGLRTGEVRGLKLSDIDFEKKVIHIRRTLARYGGKENEHTPKTRASNRDIPLTPSMLAVIDEQIHAYPFPPGDRYLFSWDDMRPISNVYCAVSINSIIKRIRADGHDFPHITMHNLRHTFATRAIEAGMNPQTLKTILGHTSLAMTMDLYSHVMADTKSREMESIESAFQNCPKSAK